MALQRDFKNLTRRPDRFNRSIHSTGFDFTFLMHLGFADIYMLVDVHARGEKKYHNFRRKKTDFVRENMRFVHDSFASFKREMLGARGGGGG